MKHLLIILSIILLYYSKYYRIVKRNNQLINFDRIHPKRTKDYINSLNKYSFYREPKYILLFDYIYSSVCEDFNAFTIFNYFQNNNYNNVYYVLNEGTELFKNLSKYNNTKNIIPFRNNKNNKHLFQFLLNSKIIVQSYSISFFQKIVRGVQ